MHSLKFFPLGNADCCRILLENGRIMLVDYAAMRDEADRSDKRCDLPALLRKELAELGRANFDVVAFSHLDNDHIRGSTEFFYLEHAKKYQDKERIKMDVMWVPAALITEKAPEDEEARILQREARYRFKEGRGIRVFSRPERLEDWCGQNGLRLEDRKGLITDAGQIAPEFGLTSDKVEFFIHSPMAVRQDEKTVEDRNADSLVFQGTFEIEGVKTRVLFLSDLTHEAIADIVDVTRAKSNDVRLEWDVTKLPHHCSYASIGPDKGNEKTVPTKQVRWLYEKQGQSGAIALSTSKPIPLPGTPEDDDPQPPHRQAANFYRDVVSDLAGQFVVTMEHPKMSSPEPIVIEIGASKATLKKNAATAVTMVTSRSAPRAG